MEATMRLIHPATVVIGCLCLLFAGAALAQSGTVADTFELGDSQQPEVPGTGDLTSLAELTGPDWQELFNADGTLKDVVDAGGNPVSNGIPDFVDLHQGRAALFVGDDVSAGSGTDLTIRYLVSNLHTGPVVAREDLTNSYIYLSGAGDSLTLYGGLERTVTQGPSSVEFEFTQGKFRLGRGWPQTTGWEIVGQRTANDVRVVVSFDADGLLSSVDLDVWQEDLDGTFKWMARESLTEEGCNPEDLAASPPIAAGTLCAFRNQVAVPGGEWSSYDATGQETSELGPDCFFEFGVNLGSLLGLTDPDFEFETVQLRTPTDLAFGYFGEGN
jgi:hypothetical protein